MKLVVGVVLAWGLWYVALSQIVIAEAGALKLQATEIASQIVTALR